MSTVGIFTIIKNEHLFLDEWIQYHINLGIDKIYVFEDVGSLSHEEICNKYDKVQLFKVTDLYSKFKAKQIIYKRNNKCDRFGFQVQFMYDIIEYVYKQKCLDWLIYIDADEFVTLENSNDHISDILDKYNDYAVVIMHWMNYNANGHIYRPAGNVIDNYKILSNTDIGCTSNKQAFNLHLWDKNVIKCNQHNPDVHSSGFKWCKTDYSANLSTFTYKNMYIRHYITKSFEDYCNKMFIRGQFANSKTVTRFFMSNPDINRYNKDIINILNSYYEKFMTGELSFTLW